jgi:hypothetical protein
MIAILFTAEEIGGIICCPLCLRIADEGYHLEPESDEEYEKLERVFGDESYWFVCRRCLELAGERLSCKL